MQCTLFLNVTFEFEKLIVDEKMNNSAKYPLENSEETFPFTLILRIDTSFQTLQCSKYLSWRGTFC